VWVAAESAPLPQRAARSDRRSGAARRSACGLKFLLDVGLDLPHLYRPAMTLSGGEAQAHSLGHPDRPRPPGVLYVLDEPSIGLHQRGQRRLLRPPCFKPSRPGQHPDRVEHDEDTIRLLTIWFDIGPGAGVHAATSWLRGVRCRTCLEAEDFPSPVPISAVALDPHTAGSAGKRRQAASSAWWPVPPPNNLQDSIFDIPLTVVCLHHRRQRQRQGAPLAECRLLHRPCEQQARPQVPFPLGLQELRGDQGRSTKGDRDRSESHRPHAPLQSRHLHRCLRSDPPGVCRHVEAKAVGLPGGGNFSQTSKGTLRGLQAARELKRLIEMKLPARCVCAVAMSAGGPLTNPRNLHVAYKGHTIAEVLQMTVEGRLPMCSGAIPGGGRLRPWWDVGLGYIKLGFNRPPPSPAARLSVVKWPRSCQNGPPARRSTLIGRAHHRPSASYGRSTS